ncbi:MAG TPA: WD40 repeat domain-containing protein [Solirubrobacteraceae bacterium]|jgi:WD40 repeat protein|nr:WD40 repeat domain-containing protein [Solirubrobacteraceae bacterium]
MGDGVTTASATSPGTTPYVGLSYYTEAKAEWFFGRKDDSQTIIGNLRAARLTVLYARSGAGKSSLLRAGVARELIERARRQLAVRGSPGYVPVVFSAWKDDPVDDLIEAIERAIEPFLVSGARSRLPRTLKAAIAAAASAVDAELLIILDQFEEYLLYHARDTAHSPFTDELAACVTDRETRANFLIAIRDDAYASLGELFAGKIPNVYGNYLQLENLDRDAAREAIVGPIEHFNELHPDEPPIEIEPALVDTVLTEVTTEQQPGGGSGQAGHDTGNGARAAREEIETPYLQLVMTRLWAHESEHGLRALRLATLEELGGAREIMRTHLDGELDALSQQDYATAVDLFRYLVTPSGTKIAFAASDLAELVEKPYDRVEKLLAHLAGEDTRIMRHIPPPAGRTRPSDRYELYHDVLAPAIVDWRRRALEQRKRAEEKRERERLEREKHEADERARAEARRRRAFQRLAIGTIGLLLVAVLLGVLAWLSRKSAVANLKAAQASQLVASSERALPSDPELSALLALRGLHLKYSAEGEEALREALPELQEARPPIRASSSVNSAVFSADGTDVLSAYEGGTATIRNATGGAVLKQLNGHAGAVEDAAFSRDGSRVLTAYKGGTAIVWDLASGREHVLPVHEGPVYTAAFSPDGGKVVTASRGGNAVVWDVATGRPLQVLRGRRDVAVNSAVFGPDGTEVLTADEDGTAIVWDWMTGTQLRVLSAHAGSVESAAFNRAGTEIVTAGEDGTARIWDAASGAQRAALSGPEGDVLGAEFSPDGNEVVTANQDRTARVWDLATGKQIMRLAGNEGPVRDASFSPDGRELVTAGQDGTTRIWDSSPREQRTLLRGHQGQMLGAAFDPGGTRIITANQNSTATIWDLSSGATITLRGHQGPVYTATFSPNGKLALTAGHDGSARIWHVENGASATVLPVGGPVDSAAFNEAGTEVVTASRGGDTTIWPAAGGRPLQLLKGSSSVEDASFSPTGNEVVTANEDGTATIWDLTDGRPRARLAASTVTLLAAAFSPNGRKVVTAGKDGVARIWSMPAGKLQLTLSPLGGPIYSAAFSPDGRTVATASEDGELRLWDAATGKQLAVLSSHEGVLFSAGFNRSGSEIVTSNQDGSADVWSTELAGSLPTVERIADERMTRTLDARQRNAYPAG